MKAVILAAGVGSRLGRPYPKSLSKLPNGETILGRQIRILRQNGINEIIVVVGFKKELIMESFTNVYYRYNSIYYITNTSKSLYKGIEDICDDIIWLNGDVVFDESIISKIVSQKGNLIAVNRSKCGEEEVKYKTNKQGNIIEISKKVKNAEGEALGINKIMKDDLQSLKNALKKCDDNDYFEKAIEYMIKDNKVFKPLDVSEYRCLEVDFQEDWELAVDMFRK